jgi:hypothetical protein
MADDKIDHEFISKLEGGRITRGYVPVASMSMSGVTIATGFDLGQRTAADLAALKLSPLLVAQLRPYLGKRKQEAVDYLKRYPLTITDSEAQQIDVAVKRAHVLSLIKKYDESASEVHFTDLPGEAQTVISSVAFQYGVNLQRRTPKFWKAVIAQDWKEAVAILNNFGDAYSARRRKEAALLGKIVK